MLNNKLKDKGGRTLTSAWIETFDVAPALEDLDSRTLTSAWIETTSPDG